MNGSLQPIHTRLAAFTALVLVATTISIFAIRHHHQRNSLPAKVTKPSKRSGVKELKKKKRERTSVPEASSEHAKQESKEITLMEANTLIHSSSAKEHERGVVALSRLTSFGKVQDYCREQGLVDVFLHDIVSECSNLAKHAAWSICNMTMNETNQQYLYESKDAFATLVRCIRPPARIPTPSISATDCAALRSRDEFVLRALANLCSKKEYSRKLVNLGILSDISDLLERNLPELNVYLPHVLRLLINISYECSDETEAFANSRLIPKVLMTLSKSTENKERALRVIKNLSTNVELHGELILGAGWVQNLCLDSNADIRELANTIMANLLRQRPIASGSS